MKALEDFGFHYLGLFRSNILYSVFFMRNQKYFQKSSELVNRGTRLSIISEIS